MTAISGDHEMKQIVRVIFLFVFVTGALAGCGLFQTPVLGPIAIRMSGEGFEVAICESIDSRGFSMSERKDNDSEWVYFWEVNQPASIHAGDILSPSRGREIGMSNGFEPSASPGTAIDIYVLDQSGEGADTIAATFEVPVSGLPSSQWLNSDGSISDHACGDR